MRKHSTSRPSLLSGSSSRDEKVHCARSCVDSHPSPHSQAGRVFPCLCPTPADSVRSIGSDRSARSPEVPSRPRHLRPGQECPRHTPPDSSEPRTPIRPPTRTGPPSWRPVTDAPTRAGCAAPTGPCVRRTTSARPPHRRSPETPRRRRPRSRPARAPRDHRRPGRTAHTARSWTTRRPVPVHAARPQARTGLGVAPLHRQGGPAVDRAVEPILRADSPAGRTGVTVTRR